jgi:uncharacterized protein YutE (UPF0331/DUF86 family)
MVNRDLLAAKLAELSDRVARVRSHARATAAELAVDRDALDLVAFNLMLAVQTCADVASPLIADEAWPVASTLGDGFQRLHEHGVLTRATADALGRAVGLRNVVAYGYGGIDVARVHAAATHGVEDLDGFAREVALWAKGHAEDAAAKRGPG